MKTLLNITPHLSTGGAPQYLLKKIQLLKEEYDIHVIEYNDYGIYRVQKDKIIELMSTDKIEQIDQKLVQHVLCQFNC